MVIIATVLYLVLIIYARLKDKKDIEKVRENHRLGSESIEIMNVCFLC